MKISDIDNRWQELDIEFICEIDDCEEIGECTLGDEHRNTIAICNNHFKEWMEAEE